jgi:hypothetical protein
LVCQTITRLAVRREGPPCPAAVKVAATVYIVPEQDVAADIKAAKAIGSSEPGNRPAMSFTRFMFEGFLVTAS